MATIKEKKSKRIDSKLFEGIKQSPAPDVVIQKVTPVTEEPAIKEKPEIKPEPEMATVFFKLDKVLKKKIDLYLVQNEIGLGDFFIALAKEKLNE